MVQKCDIIIVTYWIYYESFKGVFINRIETFETYIRWSGIPAILRGSLPADNQR